MNIKDFFIEAAKHNKNRNDNIIINIDFESLGIEISDGLKSIYSADVVFNVGKGEKIV